MRDGTKQRRGRAGGLRACGPTGWGEDTISWACRAATGCLSIDRSPSRTRST